MTMALYMTTIVIVKACGIIHIAFRVHALSNVIKMLATSDAARVSTPTSNKITRRGALEDTYTGVRSSKARVGLSSSRRVMTPASCRTCSSGITCVSNSLTRGTGSGHIDGELGMW